MNKMFLASLVTLLAVPGFAQSEHNEESADPITTEFSLDQSPYIRGPGGPGGGGGRGGGGHSPGGMRGGGGNPGQVGRGNPGHVGGNPGRSHDRGHTPGQIGGGRPGTPAPAPGRVGGNPGRSHDRGHTPGQIGNPGRDHDRSRDHRGGYGRDHSPGRIDNYPRHDRDYGRDQRRDNVGRRFPSRNDWGRGDRWWHSTWGVTWHTQYNWWPGYYYYAGACFAQDDAGYLFAGVNANTSVYNCDANTPVGGCIFVGCD